MSETTRDKIVRFLRTRRKPVSTSQLAKALNLSENRIRTVIIDERKANGAAHIRIGGYAEGKGKRVVGYLTGAGGDVKLVTYGSQYRRWTKDEEGTLRLYFAEVTLKALADMVGRNIRVVRQKLRDMDLQYSGAVRVLPRGFDEGVHSANDILQRQWSGGHVFRLTSRLPGVASVTIHNAACWGEDRDLNR